MVEFRAMARILRSVEYVARPWKNGGGTTRDIATSPAGASLDTFAWRLSLAQVDRDGPFSRFDNVDRTLVLLSGAMTLHESDRRIPLVRNQPFAFAGERAIQAMVGGGATLDFNVMTRRGRASHATRHVSFSNRSSIEANVGSTIAIFALERGLILDGEQLDVHDTAIIDAGPVSVATAAESVAALVIEIIDIHPNVL
jgi:environmental stress-induced protein Ves